MDDNCSLRPCATDFSIAAIMARHDRPRRHRANKKEDDDSASGKRYKHQHFIYFGSLTRRNNPNILRRNGKGRSNLEN